MGGPLTAALDAVGHWALEAGIGIALLAGLGAAAMTVRRHRAARPAAA